MRSRAPVLAAVTAVAVVQALAERGARTSGVPTCAQGPDATTPTPPSSPGSAGPPAPRPGAHRRRRLTVLAAGAATAPVLALALPAGLPSAALSPATSAHRLPAAAETSVSGTAGLPRTTTPPAAAREQVLAERDAARQASRARRTDAQRPAPLDAGHVPATGGGATGPPATPAAATPPPAPVPAPRPATVAPVAAPVGSEYGYRWGRLHAGLDFPAPHGTPVLAVANGVVEQAGPAGGYGNLVTVRHDDGTVTAYGHMRVIAVSAGEPVQAGQVIAEVGSEGRSTGPHLHFEVRTPEGKRDPRPWLAQRGVEV